MRGRGVWGCTHIYTCTRVLHTYTHTDIHKNSVCVRTHPYIFILIGYCLFSPPTPSLRLSLSQIYTHHGTLTAGSLMYRPDSAQDMHATGTRQVHDRYTNVVQIRRQGDRTLQGADRGRSILRQVFSRSQWNFEWRQVAAMLVSPQNTQGTLEPDHEQDR